MTATPYRAAVPALCAAVAVVALGALTAATEGGTRTLVANLGALVLAVAAGAGCLRAARRTRGATRRGWAALVVGCWAWAAGQAVWTVSENVLAVTTLYPSPADIGYLVFPLAVLAALGSFAPPGLATPRRLLDALMVACALTLLAWFTVLSSMIARGDGTPASVVVALTYPVADLVLLTVTVLTLAQTRDAPLRWGLIGSAVLAMALSDTVFAYEATGGGYVTGTVVDWGWWLAFCLLGVAGTLVTGERPVARTAPEPRSTARSAVLAYVPLSAAVLVAIVETATGRPLDPVAVALLVALVLLVLLRQYVTVRENQELARTVSQREQELHHLAFHDALTGLANRALFLDRLEHALELAARDTRPVSVAFLDLDGFKAVNDLLGHATGDALLVQVAERLRGTLRSADTLARLGGDEFAVLVEQGDDATPVANRMLEALSGPFQLGDRTAVVSASIGVATVEPGTGVGAATLLHRADVAMYAVKSSGKGDVLVHSPALDVVAHGNGPALHRAFADALENGEVRAIYQPVVDPVSGRIGALEALARWTHDGVEIPPATFVPICEQSGLSEQLTALMLEQACAQLRVWNHGLGHRRLRVAVNVNPTEFSDAGLPDRIARLLSRHGLDAGQLALEMTEIAMSNRPGTTIDVMNRLRAIGVRLALDDFGTGYSTLARLSGTPIDTVKIDRFFVADIDHDERQRRFLFGLLELGRHLGLRTVAEGVERAGQLRELRQMGCDLVQGHFVVRPATAADLTPMVLADAPVLPPHLLGRLA